MKKKELYALAVGQFVEVVWADAPPEVAMLLERVEKEKGDVCPKLFYPNRPKRNIDSHATHEQISHVFDTNIKAAVPAPVTDVGYRLVAEKKSKKK